GVIGIVASRVTEKYYKPSIILELKDDGKAVASARSIEGFNMIEAIDKIKDIMVKYGGHEGAAGFTIKQENIGKLKEKLYAYTKEKMDETNFIRPIPIDEELPFFKVSYEFYTIISKLRPFGFGNHNPVFAIKNVSINNIRKVGQTKDHIMFDIERDVTIKNCIWFNKAELHSQLNKNKNFDIAVNIKCELYRDKYYIKLFVEDVKESKNPEFKYFIPMKIYDISFPLETIVYTKVEVDVNKNFDIDLKSGYKNIPVINNTKIVGFLSDQLTYIINSHKKYFNSKFKLKFKDFCKARETDQLKLIIEKDYSFSTYATSDKILFNDIKKFLIGDFEYTSIQKKVLSSIFKDKNNTIYIGDLKRGINTVVLTCGIYFYYKKNRKLALIKKEETILPEIFAEYFDIFNETYLENINKNFIVLYNVISDKIQNGLVVSERKITIKGFNNIEDNFSLPEKIKIIDENDIEGIDSKYPIYSAKLPIDTRKEILNNIKSFNVIYATKDIYAVLN
ncbi:MAG: DHHA1 domain-containing protein, partial [bacterium]